MCLCKINISNFWGWGTWYKIVHCLPSPFFSFSHARWPATCRRTSDGHNKPHMGCKNSYAAAWCLCCRPVGTTSKLIQAVPDNNCDSRRDQRLLQRLGPGHAPRVTWCYPNDDLWRAQGPTTCYLWTGNRLCSTCMVRVTHIGCHIKVGGIHLYVSTTSFPLAYAAAFARIASYCVFEPLQHV